MTLFLVQHGEAKPESEDPERSLTERGSRDRRREWQSGLLVSGSRLIRYSTAEKGVPSRLPRSLRKG